MSKQRYSPAHSDFCSEEDYHSLDKQNVSERTLTDYLTKERLPKYTLSEHSDGKWDLLNVFSSDDDGDSEEYKDSKKRVPVQPFTTKEKREKKLLDYGAFDENDLVNTSQEESDIFEETDTEGHIVVPSVTMEPFKKSDSEKKPTIACQQSELPPSVCLTNELSDIGLCYSGDDTSVLEPFKRSPIGYMTKLSLNVESSMEMEEPPMKMVTTNLNMINKKENWIREKAVTQTGNEIKNGGDDNPRALKPSFSFRKRPCGDITLAELYFYYTVAEETRAVSANRNGNRNSLYGDHSREMQVAKDRSEDPFTLAMADEHSFDLSEFFSELPSI